MTNRFTVEQMSELRKLRHAATDAARLVLEVHGANVGTQDIGPFYLNDVRIPDRFKESALRKMLEGKK